MDTWLGWAYKRCFRVETLQALTDAMERADAAYNKSFRRMTELYRQLAAAQAEERSRLIKEIALADSKIMDYYTAKEEVSRISCGLTWQGWVGLPQ